MKVLCNITLPGGVALTSPDWTIVNGSGQTGDTGGMAVRSGNCRLGSGMVLGWSSTASASGTQDTALSRNSANVLAIGTGAAGASNGTLLVSRVGNLSVIDFLNQSISIAAPSAGRGVLFSRNWAGQATPVWRAPAGAAYSLSPHLGEKNIRGWRGANSTVAANCASVVGSMPFTAVCPGGTNIPALTNAGRLQEIKRSTLSTGTTAGDIAFIRANQTEVSRGNAAGFGGFMAVFRFALSGPLQTGLRAFAGLVDNVTDPTNIDPVTAATPGGVGLAVNAGTGNWKLVHNLSGAARTAVDLGANFPVNNTELMELALWAAPNANAFNYQVTGLFSGFTVRGNIAANTAFLAPVIWVTNNGTAAAQTLDFVSCYIETDF